MTSVLLILPLLLLLLTLALTRPCVVARPASIVRSPGDRGAASSDDAPSAAPCVALPTRHDAVHVAPGCRGQLGREATALQDEASRGRLSRRPRCRRATNHPCGIELALLCAGGPDRRAVAQIEVRRSTLAAGRSNHRIDAYRQVTGARKPVGTPPRPCFAKGCS